MEAGYARAWLVDRKHGGEFVRILALCECVVVVHRTVAPAGLQQGVIDLRILHLRQHQFRRRDDLLHTDGHILRMVVLAVDGEVHLAIAADAKIYVLQARPGIIPLPKQQRAGHFLVVARAENARGSPDLHLLHMFEMDRV